jgi:hypothetical protein
MSYPYRMKTQGKYRLSRSRLFSAQAYTLDASCLTPKNCLDAVGLVLNISLRSINSIKSYSTFSQRLTDRHTWPPIHIQMGYFFNFLFDIFHFTMFALLTLLVKDNHN